MTRPTPPGVWTLNWLTPIRCRLILALIVTLGFLAHLLYLTRNCPLDLAGDEAHYWDWSRQLDFSYYSKGPLVAYIIRASCAIFGNTMLAVRLPAMVLAVGTSILVYWLAWRLFGSDRLGLGAVLLTHLAPIFVAGSLLMTIDAPFFFCWALATCAAALAIFDNRKWAWAAIGVSAGAGFLAKYNMLMWVAGLMLFLVMDRQSRQHLRSRGPWLAVCIMLTLSLPVILWNTKHGWVSLQHVAAQTGMTSAGRNTVQNSLEFLGSQIALLGPPLFVLLAFAVADALRRPTLDLASRQRRFLLWIGLPLLVVVLLASLVTKAQGNWPAPAYFTLVVLAAGFLSIRMETVAARKRWRSWSFAAVIFSVVMLSIIHSTESVYPLVSWVNERFPQARLNIRQFDVSYKLRGWSELGSRISAELKDLGAGAFILCDHYQTTAEMAFYVAGQPKTYYAGSYFREPSVRKRFSQYDMWPDRSLDSTQLQGRNAIYVGEMNEDIERAFESVQQATLVRIIRQGFEVRIFQYWRCLGFKTMQRPDTGGQY
jgi:undecaprenyl-diphosphatase